MNMLRRSDNSLITTIFSGTTGHSVSYNILTSYQLVISFAGNAFTQFVRLGFVKGFYLSSWNASDETLYDTPVLQKLYIPVCWAKFSRGWFYSGSFLFFHEMNVNLLYRLTVTLFDIAHPVSSLDADIIP